MNSLLALAIAVGVLGGVATWFFLAVGGILIWAAFVAWACFFHSGGDGKALRSTIISNAFGVAVAATTGLVITSFPGAAAIGLPLWVALVVAASIALYILAAKAELFSSIPGTTYGYACTFAFLTQNPDKFNPQALTSLSLGNAYLVVPLSMIIGALFAYSSARLATALEGARLADA